MRRTIASYRSACYLIALASLAGCATGLTRGKAAELLSRHLDAYQTTEIKVSFSPFLFPYGIADRESLNRYNELAALYRTGYIDAVNGRVALTDKGTKASAEWKQGTDKNDWSIPVAKIELVEVTGISAKDNEASVSYTYKQKPLNDIGEALGYGEPTADIAHFRKFDDGWRLLVY